MLMHEPDRGKIGEGPLLDDMKQTGAKTAGLQAPLH